MSEGILSTYVAAANREDLSPRKSRSKRKRVAYKWDPGDEGQVSENIEDRRHENYVSDESQRPLLTKLVEYSSKPKGIAPTPIAFPNLPPMPKPRPKRKK